MAIGEALRRVIGNTVCMVTRTDVEEVVCIDQLCAGTKLGIEGAIHAVKDIFCENKASGWGVLLVDAKTRLQQHFGMRGFYGRFSILTVVGQLWLLCVVTRYCLVRKV